MTRKLFREGELKIERTFIIERTSMLFVVKLMFAVAYPF